MPKYSFIVEQETDTPHEKKDVKARGRNPPLFCPNDYKSMANDGKLKMHIDNYSFKVTKYFYPDAIE